MAKLQKDLVGFDVPPDRIEMALQRVQAGDYDYVFVDTPGVDSPGTHAAMRLANLCLLESNCHPTGSTACQ